MVALFDAVFCVRYKADMHEGNDVTIGMLRPPNVAYSRLISDEIQENVNRSDAEYNEHVSARIDDLRLIFEEAAEAVGVKFAVTEYQLHANDNCIAIVSGKRARHAVKNDILVTFDPSPTQFSFATRPRGHHPLQRSIVAFSDRGEMEDLASLLGAQRVPLFRTMYEMCLQRVFAIHLPLNDDSAADNHDHNVSVVCQAVRYPHIEPQTYTDSPGVLKIIDEDNPLSYTPHYLREDVESEDEGSRNVG